MKIMKRILLLLILPGAYFAGLYGAPAIHEARALIFPEKPYKIGDYSSLYSSGYKVAIFSTSTCPYCKKTRELLSSEGIAYTDYVVDQSPDAETKYRALGGGGVPLIYIGDREIRGFRESSIREALAALAAGTTVQYR